VLAAGLPTGAQTGSGRDHRRSSRVHGIDDLRVIDPLEIDRGHPEMGMPELSLDNDQRHALVGHLDRARMPELILAPTSAQAPLGRSARYAEVCEKVFARWDVVVNRSA